jgi:NitT/TauT family transport system permease protein
MQAIVILIILGVWQLAAGEGYIDKRILSDPIDVVARMISMLGGEDVFGYTIYEHVWQTVQELVEGYIVGSFLGIVLGVAFARVEILARVFQPYILSVYSIPKIALAPLFVLFFGIGPVSKVAIVTVGVFFMLFFNTYAGIVNVDREYVNAARIMGAGERRIFFQVVWPSALPSIFTGFKLGVPFAMIGAIVGEFIAAFQGLGYMIIQATVRFDPSAMFAGIIFLVIVVWAIGQVVARAESWLLRWQPKRQGEANVSV